MGPLLYIFLGTVNELSIGPTAIMALMTFSYAHSGGAEYAILLTFLAGFIELVAGLLNLGNFHVFENFAESLAQPSHGHDENI